MQCPNWFNSATGTADPGPYYSGVSYNFACATDYVSATGLSTFDTYDCQAAAPNWVQSSFVPCVGRNEINS